MIYPRLVFKNNGPHQRAGGTYDHLLVADEAEEAKALDAGWFGNLQEAIDAPKSEPKVESVPVPDDAPPTRAELEAKATELGIRFDRRLGDKKLADLIQKAMEV